MTDATADDGLSQELARSRALAGELATQLNEAIQARTNLGVSLRLAEVRLGVLEAENAALKEAATEPLEFGS